MATRLWDVQARLASIFTTAAPTAKVFSGPRSRSGSAPRTFVLVGSDGGETGLESTVDGLSATQQFSSLGPGTWRHETGEVICSAWAWSGNTTIDSARAALQALLTACEGAVDADPTLGDLLADPDVAEFTGHGITESQTSRGPFARVVFTIRYGALIT